MIGSVRTMAHNLQKSGSCRTLGPRREAAKKVPTDHEDLDGFIG